MLVSHLPEVRTLVIAAVACEIFAFSYQTALPVFARDVLGAGAEGLDQSLQALELPVAVCRTPAPAWPYRAADGAGADEEATVTAVPYLAWANRDVGAMRVFIPLHDDRR